MLVIVLAAIDAFGWGGLIFVGLLFGIPYSRYFLRAKAIPKWPTATATVAQASEVQGTPLGYGVVPNLLHHCSVIYEYEVNEVMYRGSFALMAGDEQDAS